MQRSARLVIALAVLVGVGILPPLAVSATGTEVYEPYSTNVFSGPSQIILPDTSTLSIINIPAAYASGLDTAHTYTWTLYISPTDSGTYQAVSTIVGSGTATRTLQWTSGSIGSGWGSWLATDDLGNFIGRGLYAPTPTVEFWSSDSNVVAGQLAYTGTISGNYLHNANPLYEAVQYDELGWTQNSFVFWREYSADVDCDTVTLPSDLVATALAMRRISTASSGGSINMGDALTYLQSGNTGVDTLSAGYLVLQCRLGFVAISDKTIIPKSGAWSAANWIYTDPTQFDMQYGVYQYVYDTFAGTDLVGNGLLPITRYEASQVITLTAPYAMRESATAKLVIESIYEPEYWTDLSDNQIDMCAPTPCVESTVDSTDYTYAATRTVSESALGTVGQGVWKSVV